MLTPGKLYKTKLTFSFSLAPSTRNLQPGKLFPPGTIVVYIKATPAFRVFGKNMCSYQFLIGETVYYMDLVHAMEKEFQEVDMEEMMITDA